MKTILIVDDELANAEVLASILSDEGYRVVCAANGRQGLERVADSHPDLVVLDFMMPLMNGAQMGEALRREPAWAHIKILMSTSLRETSVRLQFSGYDAFLRKPFSVDTALQSVLALIGPA